MALTEDITISEFSLNIPTLVFVNGLLGVLAAAMLTINWRMNRHVRGTKEWAITQWLLAAGLLCLLSRDILSPQITIVIVNALIIISTFIFLRGVSRYQGVNSVPLMFELLLTATIIILFYYYSYIQDSLNTRVILINSLIFLVMCRALIILWPTIKSAKGVGLMVAIGLVFHAFFFLSRIFLTFYLDDNKTLLEGGSGSTWVMLEISVFIFWSTISFAMLTNLVLQNNLKKLADRDPLTNLLNRRAVFEECQKLVEEEKGTSISVLVLDLDYFKQINDNYGHAIGDKALQHFAQIVSEEAPLKNLFGRTGGEEFILALPNSDVQQAERKANYICDKVRNTLLVIDEQEIHFTVSIGIANATLKNSADLRKLINDADKAMYSAKRNGRDQVAVYNVELVFNELHKT